MSRATLRDVGALASAASIAVSLSSRRVRAATPKHSLYLVLALILSGLEFARTSPMSVNNSAVRPGHCRGISTASHECLAAWSADRGLTTFGSPAWPYVLAVTWASAVGSSLMCFVCPRVSDFHQLHVFEPTLRGIRHFFTGTLLLSLVLCGLVTFHLRVRRGAAQRLAALRSCNSNARR